jgi:O-antigen ligase
MKVWNKIIEYGLYSLVFLLSWQTRWIIKAGEMEYGTYSLYGTDILLLIILLLFIIFNFQFSIFKQFSISEFSKIWLVITFLDLFVFVSIFFADDGWLALYKYGWFLLGVGLFWLVTSANYNRMKLLWVMLAGIFLQACLGIYQFLFQKSFASKWLGMALHNPAELGVSVVETIGADGIGERWLRAYGGMDHPNVLGGVLAVGVLFLIGYLVNKFSIFNFQFSNNFQFLNFQTRFKLFYYFIILLFLLALFFTFSRGAWAGLLVGVFLSLFIFLIKKDFLKQRELLKIILVGGVLVFFLFSLFGNLVTTRLSQNTRLEVKSTEERMESFSEAKAIIKNNWLFGAGIGNYTLALEKNNPGQEKWNYQPVHNVFLLVWAETGIFGLVGFLSVLGLLGWSLVRQKKYFGLSILLTLVIMMMVDHWYWSLHFGVLWLWLVVGLVFYKEENNLI